MRKTKVFSAIAIASMLTLFGPISGASADTSGTFEDEKIESVMELVENTDFQILSPLQSSFIDENFGPEAVSVDEIKNLALSKVSGEDSTAATGQFAIQSSCLSWKNAVAVLNKVFTNTDTGCALAGGSASQKTYYWDKDLNSNGSICVQGKGYTTYTEQWINGGCLAGGNVTANWRNVQAHPAIRHQAGIAPVWGIGFKWS